MAHFAKLDNNNNVISIAVVANECLDLANEESSGITFLTEWSGGYTNWKQTSYNGTFRGRYAGVGYFYDEINDVFIAPKPFDSWILDSNFNWIAPKSYPDDGNVYMWDESLGEWISG